MDYLGNDPYPKPETRGLIVDDVSYFEQQHTYLPIGSLNSLDHARNYGDTSSLKVSLDCHFRCERGSPLSREHTDGFSAHSLVILGPSLVRPCPTHVIY